MTTTRIKPVLSEATLHRIEGVVFMKGIESKCLAICANMANGRRMGNMAVGSVWCPECGSFEMEFLRRGEVPEDFPPEDLTGVWSCETCGFTERLYRKDTGY